MLTDGVSLSPAPDMLFQLYSYLTGGARRQKAKALAAGEDPDGDAATLDVLAAIEKFPGIRPDPEAFIEALDPLQPRLYSIASSPKVDPGRVALTVDTVRYKIAKRARLGVASTFLAERVRPNTPLKVYVQKAHAFGLPADPATPIIMIGPGTGVAPFRAFLHERMATKAKGRNWLFFGHQRSACDFFYEDEFAGMKAKGVLTRLSLAWSRDGDGEILRAGSHARGRPRPVALARRRRACLRLRRRQAHGEGRRARAGRHRGAARRALDRSGDRVRGGAEEAGPLPAGRLLMNAHVDPPAVRTTCPYCGVGCGILATPDGQGGAAIAGDPAHPANFGRLCSKGAALGETLGLETRLLHPMVRRDGVLVRADWDTALDRVADGFRRIIERDGPDAVAFYLSGQLLTEDYYVANKLMKGFIGSANVDTNSRLCMASSVAGHRRAFGADTVPGQYEDLDCADLIVLVGSNAAWCHPVLFQRMVENKRKRGAKLIVIDPRRTATAEDADLHLAIKPGMDTVLFGGLLVHLVNSDSFHRDFVAEHTADFDSSLARTREIAPDIGTVAQRTGLLEADVRHFYELFAATKRVVTAWSQGVNQSAQGTDKVGAIINCHLATGRIGRPGMGPFSLTGQPNAMGGREVGGLANMLAAHMNFTPAEIDRVRRFWQAPNIATHEGLKAVAMFEAIERGEIKALWVMATNPAVTLPRAGACAMR